MDPTPETHPGLFADPATPNENTPAPTDLPPKPENTADPSPEPTESARAAALVELRTRHQALQSAGVPQSFEPWLRGSTREEIEADAKTLARTLGGHR